MNSASTAPRFSSWLRATALATALMGLASMAHAQSAPNASAPGSYTVPQPSAPTSTSTGRSLVAGRDYLVLAKPMPTPTDRLEVAYFFWYNSPASAKVDPLIRQWAATKASPLVKFRPLPAVLENSWGYGARIFFALQELGKEATLGPKVMRAMDEDIVDYNSPKSLSEWMRDQGVRTKDLQTAINDPKVIAQTSWMPSLMKRYGVQRVPTVVIDGQFLFISAPEEKPEAFMSRVDFAAQVLTQRKLQQMAKQRQNQKRGS